MTLLPTGPITTLEGGVLANDGQAVTPGALGLRQPASSSTASCARAETRLAWFDLAGPRARHARQRRRCAATRSSRPTATRVAVECTDPTTGRRDIWLVGEHGAPIRLTDAPGGASDPVWSPDGQLVAFSSNPRGTRDLFAREWAASGEPRPLYGSPSTKYPSSWSRDGAQIAFTERGMGRGWNIWTLDVRTGKARALVAARLRRHRAAVLARPPLAGLHLEPQRPLGGLRAGSAGAGARSRGWCRPGSASRIRAGARRATRSISCPAIAGCSPCRRATPTAGRCWAPRRRSSPRRPSARSASACASTTPSTRTDSAC